MTEFYNTLKRNLQRIRDSNQYFSRIGNQKIGNYTLNNYSDRLIEGSKNYADYCNNHPKTTALSALSELGGAIITGCELKVASDPLASDFSSVPKGTTIIPPYVPHVHPPLPHGVIIDTEPLTANPYNVAAIVAQALLIGAPIIYNGIQNARWKREIAKIERECKSC